MAQQYLNRPHIHSRLQQMRGKAVTQGMKTDGLGDPCRFLRVFEGPLEQRWMQRALCAVPWKQPRSWTRLLPIGSQRLQKRWTQHHVAVLVPLAPLHAQDHALTVNVGHLEVQDLAQSQTRSVRDLHRRSLAKTRYSRQQPTDLLRAQRRRQPLWRALVPELHRPFPMQYFVEEEPHRADGLIQRRR